MTEIGSISKDDGRSRNSHRLSADEREADDLPELSPDFNNFGFRRALATFVTGITVVGIRIIADGAPRLVGLTVSSFNSVSLEPPLVLWSMKRTNPNIDGVARATHFTVNVLTNAQERLCTHFAQPLADRFDGIAHKISPHGAPYLEQSAAVFECGLEQVIDGGDHLIFLGRVLRILHRGGVPLLYRDGRRVELTGAAIKSEAP